MDTSLENIVGLIIFIYNILNGGYGLAA